MSADVIQHPRPPRKRAHARSWTARRLVLLAVVIAAIIAASWLAPELATQSPPAPTTQQAAAPAPALPNAAIVDIAADLAGPPPAPVRVRQTARHAGIPLDAAVTPSDDYEILSAAELEAISQARN